MIEGHGDDLYRYKGKVAHNFSTNIISDRNHDGLLYELRRELPCIGSYPEPWPLSLENKLGGILGCSRENIVVTSGATDAVYRIALIHHGGRSAVCRPTFREYQDACALHDHSVSFFDAIEGVPEESDLVWLCNPNNPTGKTWDKRELLCLAERMPSAWIVVDQAYSDYSVAPVLTVEEALSHRNIILLSSLTKRYSVPGLRVGYLTASEEICEAIRSHGLPWAVSSPAISGASYLLDHSGDYPIRKEWLHAEIMRIAEGFREMGISTSETDCNFILCRLPEGRKASDLKEYLVAEKNILIRDASNFEGLDSGYFRVAAQDEAANDLLLKGIREWILG